MILPARFFPIDLMKNFFKGKVTYIAGFGLILIGVGQIISTGVECLQQTITLGACLDALNQSWGSILDALMGIGFVGVRRAISGAVTKLS